MLLEGAIRDDAAAMNAKRHTGVAVHRPLIGFGAVASIALLLPLAFGHAADGPCYLEVEGRIYLDKVCHIDGKSGNDVSIGTGDNSREQFFAYVQVGESPDRAEGYWNGPSAESRAHVRLGTLTREGNCWINAHAKVCAGAR